MSGLQIAAFSMSAILIAIGWSGLMWAALGKRIPIYVLACAVGGWAIGTALGYALTELVGK